MFKIRYMKSLMKYVVASLSFVVLLTSCNDAFLDRFPMDEVTDENFWQSEEHIEQVANTFTSSLRGKDMLNIVEIMSDNTPWAVSSAYRSIGGGNYTKDISQINSMWKSCYYSIGRVNYYLENYNRAQDVSVEFRERYAAEAYFYRAYNYLILTSFFGDVPYITDVLNVDSPDVFRSRDKRADVVDAITKDLEKYYQNLPDHIVAASTEFGRVSQTAALALLSRIYLYNERWEDAVDAAERAMQSSYYGVYDAGDPATNYLNLFNFKGRASRVAQNNEILLSFIYNYDLGEDARTSHNLSRELWVPNDYSRFVPTKSLIESYLTNDGKIWDSNVGSYEAVFQDRDPRMTQSILPPNTPWEGAKDGNPSNTDSKMFTYPKFINKKDGCMTYTGYYLRKYAEPSKVGTVGHDDNDIVAIRFAEVLLNYVEAKEQLGNLTQADIDKTINLLRDRVGMAHLKLSEIPAGSTIREEIHRERRVELLFEGQRYFDLIRWGKGAALGEDLLGVCRDYLDQTKMDADLDKLSWKEVDGREYLILETGRLFDPSKHSLLPIPFAQEQLNPNLLPNNPGW